MLYERPIFRIMGDRALLVELGDEIHPSVNEKVGELFTALEEKRIEGVIELVPTYRSIMAVYDPLKTTCSGVREQVENLLKWENAREACEPKKLAVPVAYGGEYGPDLGWVADYHGLSQEEIVKLHTDQTYRVYMIGFMPGFAYLGELPEALITPRRKTPRTAVPKGSVGIAQKQTGIYPVQSPGGWQVIGRTPLSLFDPAKWPPTPLEMGTLVEFFRITEEEFASWESQKP